jgi:hypothetical protein
VPWYYRVRNAINAATPFLAPTQRTNLALLVSALLNKRTLCLSELARAYPTPKKRRVTAPKHCLLHRLKRLWRFTNNERVDALAVQVAFVAHTIARLGFPRLVGVAIDWTMFDATLPSGGRIRYPRSCVWLSRGKDGRCPCCSWPTIGIACLPKGARTSSSRTPCSP